MRATEITKDKVKLWVVKHSVVNNPYKKKWWWASVTIGYDYAEKGETIEKALVALTDFIFSEPFIMAQLMTYQSFKDLLYAQR